MNNVLKVPQNYEERKKAFAGIVDEYSDLELIMAALAKIMAGSSSPYSVAIREELMKRSTRKK